MHTNMFSYWPSRKEVKAALNEHQTRDSKRLTVLDIMFFLSIVYLIRDFSFLDAIAIWVAAFTGVYGMRYFVDQSVRNFYLHRLDWEEAEKDGL
jgi:hypothetical protein